jgi:Bacterial pre-peptidase C-terminal domain
VKTLGTLFLILAIGALVACGGGGASSSSTPPAPLASNPSPSVSSLSPNTIVATSGAFTLTVNGTGFVSASVVQWNGSHRPTTFVNATQLSAAISGADVAAAGTATVTVVNPAPGGGLSAGLPFGISPLQAPAISSINPPTITAGSASVNLTISGFNFTGVSVVRWNGADRGTTFGDSNTLTVTIPASDLASAAIAAVTVFTPGAGSSQGAPFFVNAATTALSLQTSHMIWDPTRQKILASVPSFAGAPFANSVAIIDPVTHSVVGSIATAADPDRLALSDDGTTLWVGVDGVKSVQRVDMVTQTAGAQFSLGSDGFGGFTAQDIKVAPGSQDTIAVARKEPFGNRGVAIYDNGVQRIDTVTSQADSIAFGASATTLYGFNNENTEFGFRRMTLTPTGLTVQDVTPAVAGFGATIQFQNGLVYFSSGLVLDPTVTPPKAQGTFPPPISGFTTAFLPSPVDSKAYYMGGPDTAGGLYIFGLTTFEVLAHVPIDLGNPGNVGGAQDLIRYGSDGIAIRTNGQFTGPGVQGGGKIVFLDNTKVAPPPPIAIATSQLPPTTGKKFYQFQLLAEAALPVREWFIVGGGLPSGIFLGSDGVLKGVAPSVGVDTTATFTVQASDFTGGSATKQLSILVKAGALGSNDTCSAATPISNGTIRGSISPHGDIDVYSFTASAGSALNIDTFGQRLDNHTPQFPASFVDTVVELLDSSCSPVAVNDDADRTTLDSHLTFTIPTTGTYFLRVSDAQGDGRPDFVYDLQLSGAK